MTDGTLRSKNLSFLPTARMRGKIEHAAVRRKSERVINRESRNEARCKWAVTEWVSDPMEMRGRSGG